MEQITSFGQHCVHLNGDAWKAHELSIQANGAPGTISGNQKQWKREQTSGILQETQNYLDIAKQLLKNGHVASFYLQRVRTFFAFGQNLVRKQALGYIYNKTKYSTEDLYSNIGKLRETTELYSGNRDQNTNCSRSYCIAVENLVRCTALYDLSMYSLLSYCFFLH